MCVYETRIFSVVPKNCKQPGLSWLSLYDPLVLFVQCIGRDLLLPGLAGGGSIGDAGLEDCRLSMDSVEGVGDLSAGLSGTSAGGVFSLSSTDEQLASSSSVRDQGWSLTQTCSV